MQGNALTVLLSGKKYLLLQGPMGPFFNDVAEWLESLGRNAVNVVFNGGDRFYCRHRQYLAYYQTPKEFPGWLRDLHRQYDFDTILCFGDCRPLHKEAKRWAKSKGIRFLAFEEGYLRPQFITVEEDGVNAYSSLPRDPDFYRKLPDMPTPHVENLKPSTMKRIGHAMWYYLMGWHYRHEFPRYRHHKSFSPWYEARCWVRAYWRKQLYKVTQRKVLPRLMNELDQRYYLAVLQVYNDSQIRNHSNYNDVRDYINEVMYSFSRKAPKESYLVIKHHPMDRGHRLYRPLIKRLSKEYGLSERVIYVHDLPMPELLRHAKAVVTINSTAGISALIHNKPLKVMGNALYDIKGKLMGQPLYKVLGGSVNQIVTDMTVGIDTPEAMAAEARERVEKDGFTILKIKAGINPIEDIQALTLIRQAVGPNIRLRVDANQGYTVSDAVRTLKAFEELGVEAVEQCLPSWDLDGMRFVRSKVDLKVMLDESIHTPIDAAKACKIDAADIINIKLMKCGGLYPAEKINAIAEANHVQCMVGCMLETKVAIAAGVSLVAAKQNITEADCDSFMYAVDPEMGMPGGFAVNGGVYTLSDKPGLGIDIDF